MKKLFTSVIISALLLTLAISGCYYDSEEALYFENCDTTIVTYTKSIAPVFSGYCNSCHSGSAAQLNIVTDNYKSVVNAIDRISGAINHKNGFKPMPYPAGSLSDCDLSKFNIWVRKGMPE